MLKEPLQRSDIDNQPMAPLCKHQIGSHWHIEKPEGGEGATEARIEAIFQKGGTHGASTNMTFRARSVQRQLQQRQTD